jgi:hypothetical protein
MINKKYKSHKKQQKSKKIIFFFVGFATVSMLGALFVYYRMNQSPIEIPKAVTFGVWYPANSPEYTLKKDSVKYESEINTLTFMIDKKSNQTENLTITEQAVPEIFSVSPDEFDKQVASLQQVTKFDSVHGPVALTQPLSNGKTTAIMKAQGTIVYVHTEKTLTTDEWRNLFNSMELIER